MTLSDHGPLVGFPLALYVLYDPNRPDLDVFKAYIQGDWDYITWRTCKDMDNKTQTAASSKVNKAVALIGENGIHFAVDH